MTAPIDLGNPATTRVPLHELIRERWSPREFSSEVPSREVLLALFEAARWAPSSFGEQPWSFLLATSENSAEHERLANCLVPQNREWAAQAPVLALSIASTRFRRNDKVNQHAWHDVGLAVSQLTAQATGLGLVMHQMAGFDAVLARKTFQLPESQEPVAAMAVGYAVPVRSAALAAERSRKPLEEQLFEGRWGEPHKLVKT